MEVVVNFGGGLNSTAMIIRAIDKGEPPPRAVLFADTFAERAGTYQTLADLSAYCVKSGWPAITSVNNRDRPDGSVGPHDSLEAECLTNETLPGIAFGHRGCSRKWKIQPMDRWIRHQGWALAAWERGEKITRWIGYDTGEGNRNVEDDKKFHYRFPLREWGVDRQGCVDIVRASPVAVPTKSACFFCSAMKPKEVIALKREKPDLFERARAIEKGAEPDLCSVAGLGRNFNWGRLVEMDEAQLRLFPQDAGAEPCIICWDGEPDQEDA